MNKRGGPNKNGGGPKNFRKLISGGGTTIKDLRVGMNYAWCKCFFTFLAFPKEHKHVYKFKTFV